jgi:ElaA protein
MAADTDDDTLIEWRWCRFEDLGLDDLYDALAVRSRIFVVEQKCPYLDADGLDRNAWHLLGRDDDTGELVAYVRVVDPGHKFDVPSIGRVVVTESQRGTGLGHRLMDEALCRTDAQWPGQGNRIGAQAHLQGFYGRHGYAPVGEPYLEDDIPHIDMERGAR